MEGLGGGEGTSKVLEIPVIFLLSYELIIKMCVRTRPV